MRSLFIDTSSFFMFVSILEGDKILYSFKEGIKNDMASKMLPTIENAFQNVSFSVQDIDRIYVVNGPGSFTGVRVGVTTAKTIAWALKKEIVELSSLQFLATTPVSTEYRVAAIDARRGYVYGGVYDSNLNVVLEDQYLPFEELKKYLEKGTLISRDELSGKVVPEENVLTIVKKHQEDVGVNPHEVKPNYLKLTEAEEKKLAGE